ncbi:hypothetical protein EG68_11851, partial [Paragonimus skrjabini miyazakii]
SFYWTVTGTPTSEDLCPRCLHVAPKSVRKCKGQSELRRPACALQYMQTLVCCVAFGLRADTFSTECQGLLFSGIVTLCATCP